MLIGLTKDKKVDIYDESEAKEFLNKDYQMHLFPVGTDASLFTRLETCEALKEFKKAVISFKISQYNMNRGIVSETKSDFFVDTEKRSTVEITNVVDFVKFLHSLVELNSFNTMFQMKDKWGAFIFVLSDFVMEVKYGNTKDSLKIKEKHRKLSNDFIGILNGEEELNTYLISTVLLAIDDFFGIGTKNHKPQLFDCTDMKIYLNEKLTKWDTRNSFKGQTLISESLINSNALTFVNTDIDKILEMLKVGDVSNRRALCGCIRICQYIEMMDEDDIPIEEPLTIRAVHALAESWFDIHDILVYPLYTPADYVEAACMAYYMLRTSVLQLDLMQEDYIRYKSMLEIDFAVYQTGTDDDKFLSDDYAITLYESDLEESHEKDSVLKELISSVCRYLKDMHVL